MQDDDRSTALVDAVPDAVLVIDGAGRLVHVNAATACLFGWSREELVGRDHATLLGEAFAAHLAQVLAAHDGSATVHRAGADLDAHGRRRDGGEFPVEVNFTVAERDGEIEVVASVRDVTERRDTEAELRTALSLVNATLESTADGILVVTADGRISGANERFAELWQIPPELMAAGDDDQLLGYVLDQLVDAPAFVAKVQDLYDHPTAESNDVVEFRDGRVFERYSRPQRVGEEIVGRVWSFRDVTEARVRERELGEARRAAVEAARAKSDFLATMSHEIRTPMNGVIGLTGLLLETDLDDVQRRYAAGVRGAGEALLAIVDDILDFSKLEAGKVDLESVDFSPRELVEELGVLLADAADSHGLEFLVRCEEPLPAAVSGDPRRLRQALINLVGNAIKFTPAGEVSVTVTALGEADPGVGQPVRLRFAVTDTGIGIEEQALDRLFEPFSQADASTTRRFGGTGLGLAISRRLVDAMEGALDVDSEPGVGSTFTVTVDLPAAAAPAHAPSHDLARLHPLSLLVVDDNESNRQILAADAGGLGVGSVVTAGGAGEALAQLRAAATAGRPYDLALLDLLMPDTDGLTLAETIAADPLLRRTGLLILTSGGGLDTGRARAAGVTVWVSKPVRRDELGQALLRVVEGREAPAPEVAHEKGAAPRPPAGSGRVLVAEDNPVNQMVALGLLESLGYAASLVQDGAQALAALAADEYDAVLMDCHMPEMDGFRATTELRKREGGGRRTPVIAMTAGVLDEDRERCLAAGMDDFVAKPIDAEDLRRALARWVDGETVSATEVDEASEPVLEHEQLDALRRIGPDDGWGVLPAVVRVFLEGAAELAAQVRGNVAAGELAAAGDAAHTLKGAAANLGAERLVAACQRVERAADGGTAPSEELLVALDGELAAAETQLRRLLEQAP